MTEFKKKYPRVLIISNNPLSNTNNNGKTIMSFFKEYPKDKIRQLFFENSIPTGKGIDSFFRITDQNILKASRSKDKEIGEVVSTDLLPRKDSSSGREKISIPKNNSTRLIRELLWKNRFLNNKQLYKWLDEFKPEMIFFVAGDTGFVYDYVFKIKERFNTKLITYVTDDYILERNTFNIAWKIRQRQIYKKMKNAINISEAFYVISNEMKETYFHIFQKKGNILLNATESMKNPSNKLVSSKHINFLYAGGLHLGRDEVLSDLAQTIKKYNRTTTGKKAKLTIFSNTPPNNDLNKKLNVNMASELKGKLPPEKLRDELNIADVLVHVESFKKKSIESTKLSISTKIPEYLSLGKPIFAIGPESISSMKYLSDCAFCVGDIKNLDKKIKFFLENKDLWKTLGEKAQAKYRLNHNQEEIVGKFIKDLKSIYIGD